MHEDTESSNTSQPSVTDVMRHHPRLLDRLARAALAAHLNAASARAQRAAMPEVFESVREIAALVTSLPRRSRHPR